MRRLLVLPGVMVALSGSPALGATVTVQVGQDSHGLPADAYNAANITINPGDKVNWNWDGIDHSVTSGSPPGTSNGQFDSKVRTNLPSTFPQTFSHPGLYHYFCRIHYAFGMVGTVRVTGTDPRPTAAFTASPSSPTARQAVTFDAGGSSTSDSDTIESYTWNFGDGTQQTTNSPTTQHTFKSAGAPTVTLTITDAGSATSSPTSHALTIKAAPQSPPTARFKFSPAHPVAGQAVRFDASRSSDTDGDSITSYKWTFGDGTKLTTAKAMASHHYARAGPVTVSLVVVDSHGLASAAVSHRIGVGPAPAVLTNARLSPHRFCVSKTRSCTHPGSKLTFKLSRASNVSEVVASGHKTVSRPQLHGQRGANSFAFHGVGLRPGRYVLILTPVGGKSVRVDFTVLAG